MKRAQATKKKRSIYTFSEGKFWRFRFAKYLPVSKGAKILDAGCGDGRFLSFLKTLGYKRAVGVDLSYSKVKLAQKYAQVYKRDINSFLASKKQTFDLIFARDLIEHLSRKDGLKFLKNISHALTPGGLVVIQTINPYSPFFGHYWSDDLTHQCVWGPRLLSSNLAQLGLKTIEFQETGPVPSGWISIVRFCLWQICRLFLILYNLIEIGPVKRYPLTRNYILISQK